MGASFEGRDLNQDITKLAHSLSEGTLDGVENTLEITVPEPWDERNVHDPKPMAHGEELGKRRFIISIARGKKENSAGAM